MNAMHGMHDHGNTCARGSQTAQTILFVPMRMDHMRLPILIKPIQPLCDLHGTQHALIQYLCWDTVGREEIIQDSLIEQDGTNI